MVSRKKHFLTSIDYIFLFCCSVRTNTSVGVIESTYKMRVLQPEEVKLKGNVMVFQRSIS